MRLGLFIPNTNRNWGPGKLSHNTIMGLDRLGIEYCINEYSDYNFCICGDKFNRFFANNKIEKSIIGPCSLNIPTDNKSSFSMYNFLVASEWYMNNWKTYGVDNVDYWYGGIDTDLFIDKKVKSNTCFIYYKNRGYNELKVVTDILNKIGIKYNVINYGSYTESEFMEINNNSRFGIILSNTETQGFAIMESMSMNTPLFVLDKNNWNNLYYNATSVPYFSEECGVIVKESDFHSDFIESELNRFIDGLNHYSPMNFIKNAYKIEDSINLLLKKII